MATFLDLEGPEIAYCEDPVANPFPDQWRRESALYNQMPLYGELGLKKLYQGGKARKSDQVIKDCLSNTKQPITMVTTGPLTNVARVFEDRPELKNKVEEFVIMGGAIKVPGNVEQEKSDGSAEWNIFADPQAAKIVFDLGVPICLVPLDVTNELPFDKEFLGKVLAQAENYQASRLAGSMWSLVKGIVYYFWDTVTAAAVIEPSLFKFRDMRIDVATSGKAQGRTSPVLFGGRKVKCAIGVDKDGFKDLLLDLLATK
jgi:purine nucleosidase